GDGKHEHPSQALLDLYTLLRHVKSLEGREIWIVGDVMHSRVARSNVLAFARMGARVTVAGPPTLIPRDFETLGCEIAYDLERLAGPDGGAAGVRMRLSSRGTPSASLLVRRAHVVDPRAGLDGLRDVLVREGRIAELAPPGALESADVTEAVDGEGLHVFPAFVDPHVHLRTPGREDEEDLESGTRAAAAGGF